VIEGLSMSGRTRDALLSIDELGAHHYGGHRSHQLNADDVLWADVILASEADHVRYVYRNFPDHANKTVQLVQFIRTAPLDGTFEQKLEVVALLQPLPETDVADPAGGDQATYNECARQLWELGQAFAMLVAAQGSA
jgi:protein-tyrosine-phosphatase